MSPTDDDARAALSPSERLASVVTGYRAAIQHTTEALAVLEAVSPQPFTGHRMPRLP
jgi:hypothetical protein